MVEVKSPSRIAEDRRRYGKSPMTDAQWKRAEKRYDNYRAAKRVWRQITDDERVYLLRSFGYKEPEAANARDENHDMRELNLGKGAEVDRRLIAIRNYPRTQHRQDIYKAKLAKSPPRKDVAVRKHEKRLRSASYTRHERRSRMGRRPW